MSVTRTRQDAEAAFTEARTIALAQLDRARLGIERIVQARATLGEKGTDLGRNWAWVADMAYAATSLSEIADQMLGEGEHAK